ncbi:MAG TPA: hypothetical protein PKC11_04730 [Agitococcus sp.]|nr:hypothetical protein [Agitococcus sp.]HMX98853.1 hypothetical protein [Agitococcus sp.]HNA69981.1 hypothetical protein [Nitrosomonas sp.]
MASVGGVATIPGYSKPLGYQQITSLGSAVGFSSVPSRARLVMIQAESQNVRWRDDGVNPTASVGMVIVANDTLFYTGDFSAIKFIEVTGSAKLNIIFYE